MQNLPSIVQIYKLLVQYGLPQELINVLLPDWWDEECDHEPKVQLEGLLYISRRINQDLDWLCKGILKTKLDVSYEFRSKKKEIIHGFLYRIADLVCMCSINKHRQEINKYILQSTGILNSNKNLYK